MRLELTSGSAATCFQDRLLIQPDDLRLQKRSGVGVKPQDSLDCRPQPSSSLSLGGLVAGSEPGVTTDSNCPGSDVLDDTMTRPTQPKFGEQDLNLHILVQSQAAYR